MLPIELEFTKRFIDNVLGVDLPLGQIETTLTQACFNTLTRQEEVNSSARDQWGNWDWPYCDAQRRGELYTPWLDLPLAQLRHNQSTAPKTTIEPLWPGNKPFALCLTHDVDDVPRVSGLRSMARSLQLAIRNRKNPNKIIERFWLKARNVASKKRPSTPLPQRDYEDWLKIEDQYGFKSTLFFFPAHLESPHPYDCIYQFQDVITYSHQKTTVSEMMKEIDRAGWEVGLHGSYHSAIESNLLRGEKQQIEEIVGHPITSTRQHFLHYEVGLTPQLQVQAGFKVDSTHGFNRSIGFRAGTSFPYWCWNHQTQQPTEVLEIPQHIMDGGLFTKDALQYNQELAIRHSVQLMDIVEQVGGCLTLNWHMHALNDDKWWNVYVTLLDEGHRRGAWGCSAKQIYEWWTAREQRIAENARTAAS